MALAASRNVGAMGSPRVIQLLGSVRVLLVILALDAGKVSSTGIGTNALITGTGSVIDFRMS